MAKTSKRAWAVALTALFAPIGCAAYQQPDTSWNHHHVQEEIRVPPILEDAKHWLKLADRSVIRR